MFVIERLGLTVTVMVLALLMGQSPMAGVASLVATSVHLVAGVICPAAGSNHLVAEVTCPVARAVHLWLGDLPCGQG